jgi:phage shock protein A
MSTQPNNVERLIVDFKESFEREIHEFREEMKTRFDNQAARMERQGAFIQTGSRWTARMNEWSEKVDAALEQKDKQIAALTERVDKLERGKG